MQGQDYIKVAFALTGLLQVAKSYAQYRSARKKGESRSEIILRQSGGAEKLLKKAKIEKRLAFALMLGPFVTFIISSQPFVHNLSLVILIEIITLPLALLLLWFSRVARKVVDADRQKSA
jgi:hypothetical protein